MHLLLSGCPSVRPFVHSSRFLVHAISYRPCMLREWSLFTSCKGEGWSVDFREGHEMKTKVTGRVIITKSSLLGGSKVDQLAKPTILIFERRVICLLVSVFPQTFFHMRVAFSRPPPPPPPPQIFRVWNHFLIPG